MGMEKAKGEPVRPSRRDFLKRLGLLGASALVSPVTNAVEGFSTQESKDIVKRHEQFITDQVNKIKEIIINKRHDKILSNPYLAHCLYFSKIFLEKVSNPKHQRYVSEKIIGSVAPLVTAEFRVQAIRALEKQTKDKERLENRKISAKEIAPLKSFSFGIGENHKDAVDLFAEESSPIHSMGSGLVIIAENGWRLNDELSTSSMRGGNTVIIYNYLTREFSRYAHLKEVAVKQGKLIIEGEILGTVGHTGDNASLPGHGKHLHFEINKYADDTNLSLSADDLKQRLKTVRRVA